jgi:hypothetical protein
VAIGEAADDARAPANLAHDALRQIVGSNPPPVLLGTRVVRERFDRSLAHERCGFKPTTLRSSSKTLDSERFGDGAFRRQ